jgi:colanic acid biosynthesis glycosyl transferase WcaI
MRISILSQWYLPEPADLLHELACDLQELGHDIQIITGFPNYPSGRLYPGYHLRPWMRERIDGVDLLRLPLYPDHSRSGFKRAANYLSFALSTSVAGPFLARRPDVIFVYHPPLTVGLPAWVLSRFWRVPFVYQVQDMWPETLQATGMLSNGRVLRGIDRLARFVYRKAAAVCVISPGFKVTLVEKGVPTDKIFVVSNWVDRKVYYPANVDMSMAEELGLAGKFIVMFAGNMGEAQRLQTVIDAAGKLSSLKEVEFVLVGDGIALGELNEETRRRGLKNVRFLGRYPAEAMPGLYALADVLLVHLKNDPLFEITIPHKIFSYMASGKPILAAVQGDAANVITSAGAGITCPPEDAEALACAVHELYEMPAPEREAMARSGLRAAQEEYSREVLVSQIASLLSSLVEPGKSDKKE